MANFMSYIIKKDIIPSLLSSNPNYLLPIPQSQMITLLLISLKK